MAKTYTSDELADILKISRYTLLRWIATGKITEYIKAGRRYIFSQDMVDRLLASMIVETKHKHHAKQGE